MTTLTAENIYFLLVDDLEENLLSLEALLRRPGLTTLKAKSGPEALELLLKHDIALTLLDVQMPGMDGFELAELMRGNDRTRRVPIIFLTAGTTDAQRRFHGYEKGAVDFLQKPIETDILRSKAEVFFDLHLQQKILARHRDELKQSSELNATLLAESRKYAAALQEADRRKDEFLATLAHELRNPLAPVRNGIKILNMSPQNNDTKELLGIMDRQVTHLVRLIDDLLDVSRVSQGKIDLRKDTVTIQDIISLALETSGPIIEASHHNLTIDMDDTPLHIYGDLNRLSQTVSNLLNNAAKYTPENGKITLSVKKTLDDIIIAVSDNGIGIPKERLTDIFDLFTQVGREMEKTQGGLGIGLALVKRLIDMHGGNIHAESAGSDKGSTFTLRLPLSEDVKDIQIPVTTEELAATEESLRILVVDDNIPSAQTTGWMLEMIGHVPTLAFDGIEAIEVAKKMNPNAILLDIGLPGMNGYDVCRALRQDPMFKDTLIIAQTGWGQERDKKLAFEAGFDHHLIKPFNFDQLSELLNKPSE